MSERDEALVASLLIWAMLTLLYVLGFDHVVTWLLGAVSAFLFGYLAAQLGGKREKDFILGVPRTYIRHT